jgi:subtilase family serine protease
VAVCGFHGTRGSEVKKKYRVAKVLAAAVPLAVLALAAPAAGASGVNPQRGLAHRLVHVCARAPLGYASCAAIVDELVGPSGKPVKSTVVSGYGPSNLQAAYSLPSSSDGSGQTVAVVDAYNDPSAASDLGTYRSYFGLPACKYGTATTSCLRIVNQNGGSSLPRNNGGWAQEESLDLDMVSAICPNCHIILVEASSASLTNLGTAVDEAAKLGATEISNSYGGSESSSDTSYDRTYYDHPGIAVTASTGDNGYGVEYPASSPYVTAAGGTTLTDTNGTYSETAWSGSGSGCSAYEPQPAWQSSLTNISDVCRYRAVADVSADANPNTGVAVYDSTPYQGLSGWLVFGGTSVASPVIASVYALAGGEPSGYSGAAYAYANASHLHDITSGSTGSCGTDLCNAGPGWDGPTGLGSPDGIGAF